MKADLHLHSTYSDGKNTPDEICAIAQSRGLSLLSITDHDTMMGLEDKKASAKRYGLHYLTGWEISAYEGEEKIHILGYGCQLRGEYEAFTAKRKNASLARITESVQKCNAIGIPVTVEEVLSMRLQEGAPVHTMHLARALQKYVSGTDGEIYEKYLSRGKVANSNIGRPSPKEAIEIIHALGGVAVLAHPGRIPLTKSQKEALIFSLISCGLDGIEALYTTHTERETEYFQSLAKAHNLIITGGSDTHVEDGTHAIGTPHYEAMDKRLLSLIIAP
ncbi:MAG: PHP domain-containing protein [Clostridiales bacterium]|nr:PHP domain-containing protein [Clostridiales bacterium]